MNQEILQAEYDNARKVLSLANKGIGVSKSVAMSLLWKARHRLAGKPPVESFNAHFETTVCGIPCGVYVWHYIAEEVIRGSLSQRIDPPEPEEIGFIVLDRNGRKADWLQKKMTSVDQEKIEEMIRRGDE